LISEGIKLRPGKPSAIYFPELEDWIPVDDCFVRLDPKVKDKWGLPVARAGASI